VKRSGILIALAGLLLAAAPEEQVVRLSAKKYDFTPEAVELKLGVPIVLEITSLDRKHGFAAPELGLRAEIPAGETVRLRFTPQKAGTFEFHCDVFCGSGHEEMNGRIVVKP